MRKPRRINPCHDDFGLWDVFVSMFWFMLLFAWIWMIIAILTDIFRDRTLSGGAKALWALFILLIPWLGALVYIFARGDSMNERNHQAALDQQAQMRAYVGATPARRTSPTSCGGWPSSATAVSSPRRVRRGQGQGPGVTPCAGSLLLRQ